MPYSIKRVPYLTKSVGGVLNLPYLGLEPLGG